MITYFPPKFKEKEYHCPYCNVYASQEWGEVYKDAFRGFSTIEDLEMCTCAHCKNVSLWFKEKLVIPDVSTAPPAHVDMPADIVDDYIEAASILTKSPRGSAALLRLVLQKLMTVLGESGKDINKDIGSLVQKGLPPQVQQALDIVRVIGNESVHPGTINLKDDLEIATNLFGLINFIVEDRISKPKMIKALFDKLPEGKRNGIESRDSVKTP